jgi:hypothetical protein
LATAATPFFGFYPNYFYWSDCSFQRMRQNHGLRRRELRRRLNAATPHVDAGSWFLTRARYDDVLSVSATSDIWEAKPFKIRYDRLSATGRLPTASR